MTENISFRDGGKTDEEGIGRPIRKNFDNEGVIGTGDLLVTERGAGATKTVDIAAGEIHIHEGDYLYYGFNTATVNKAIGDNATGNPRIDAVSAYVDKSVVSSATANNPAALVFKVTAGTAGASPTAPSDGDIQNDIGAGNPFHRLAAVDAANGFTEINDEEIEDRRQWTLPTAEIRRDYDTNPERVISGLLFPVPGGGGLAGIMSTGSAYVRGYYVRKDNNASEAEDFTFTASKDTYVDIDKTGTVTYDPITLNDPEPAVAADSIRLCKVVTDATDITSVTDLRNLYARGLITASSNLTLTTAFQTVVGTSITFEASQISYMDIKYQYTMDGGGGTNPTNIGDDILAHMDLDGSDLTGGATAHTTHEVAVASTTAMINGVISTPLTAAAHTLLMEVKNNTGARGEVEVVGSMTGYTYEIHPGIGAAV